MWQTRRGGDGERGCEILLRVVLDGLHVVTKSWDNDRRCHGSKVFYTESEKRE